MSAEDRLAISELIALHGHIMQGRGAYHEHDAKPYRWTYNGSPLKAA